MHLHENEAFPKDGSYIANIGVWKHVFTCVVIKINIFHSCRTRVVCVAFVPHSFRSCGTRVALVLHWCRFRVTRGSLVSLVPGACVLKSCLAICATQLAGGLLLKMLKYFEVMSKIFESSHQKESVVYWLVFANKFLWNIQSCFLNDIIKRSYCQLLFLTF